MSENQSLNNFIFTYLMDNLRDMQRDLQIHCLHTPESLSRLIAPLRRKGLSPENVAYSINDDRVTALCSIRFTCDERDCHLIMSNLKAMSIVNEINVNNP